MYVVVIGLGQVGRHVVRVLEQEGHQLVAVDSDRDSVRFVEEHHDVMTMEGHGATPQVLTEAGVERADLVVAVTNTDEVNLIAALAARRLGAKRVVARVQGLAYGASTEGISYGLLGVDVVINPRILLAQEIAQIARSHGALEVIDLANARLELVQVQLSPNSRLVHKPLSKLQLPDNVLVAAVVRDGDLFVPGGADVLLPEDRAYLIGRTGQMEAAEDLFTTSREAHKVCIVGGGVVGSALARTLANDPESEILIIERDREVAERLAGEIARVTVVHGDGTDMELLSEEEVGRYDLFVAVSHEDEVNLMAGLLAKRAGAQRTLALVHRPDYMPIYRQLGIDIVLSPRLVASDHILRFVRSTEVQSLTVLEGGLAEVLELNALDGCRAIGRPLRRMNVPPGAILAAIIHGEEVIIPRGDDVIRAGDTVIVLATPPARAGVERLFRPRAL